MPTFEIQTPDGRTFQIDGPDQQGAITALEAHLKANNGYGVKNKSAEEYVQPEPPPGVNIHASNGDFFSQGGGKYTPTNDAEMAARFNREKGGMAGDRADALARGLPFLGEFLPRARSAVNSLFGGGDYASNLEAEQARTRTYDADHPVESMGLRFVGPVAATVAAGGAAPVVRGLMGLGGSTVPSSMALGGLAGALQGGTSAAGQAQDLSAPGFSQADMDILKGAGLGFLIGGAVPAGAAGLGKVWEMLRSRSDVLSNLSGPAREWITNQFDPSKIGLLKQEADKLGPQGMLADVSPEFQGVASAAGSRPGSREPVINALMERDAGKNARIRGSVDAEFGPAPIKNDIVSSIKGNQEALGPEYGAVFKNASRVDTKPIADALDTSIVDLRGDAQKAMMSVRKMLNVHGTDQLDPNPTTLFQTRQAIDGLLATENNPKAVAALTEIRRRVDDTLGQAVPGIKDVDAKFQELARQKEGLQTGTQALDSGREAVTPTELARDFPASANPQGSLVGPSATPLRIRQGARAEMERIIGTNANDVEALQRLIKGEGDWNRDRLRTLFGPDKAERLFTVLDREKTFQNTKNSVTGNSATASRQEFNKLADELAKGNRISTDTTLAGTAFRGVQKLADALAERSGDAASRQFVDQLGRLSVATGSERDKIITALMKRGVTAKNLRALYSAAGGAGASSAGLVNALAGSGSPTSQRP